MYRDEQIMNFVQEGNFQQMGELYNRHYKRIYNFFRKMQLEQSISEDLTQNTFERVMKYKDSFKQDSQFVPWLYRIASNVKNDHYRGQKLKIAGEVNEEVYRNKDVYKMENSSEDEQKDRLKLAMKKLTTDQQQLIWMAKYEGMKYEEVAQIMDLTISNVKVKIHRAIKDLRNIYIEMQEV